MFWSGESYESFYGWVFSFSTGDLSWIDRGIPFSARGLAVWSRSELSSVSLPFRTGSIEGSIYYDHGRPVDNAAVIASATFSFSSRPLSAVVVRETRSSDGYYLITDLPAGVYTLEANQAWCEGSVCDKVLVEPDSVVTCDFDAASGRSLRDKAGLITGRVETSHGLPLSGVMVLGLGNSLGALTDSCGVYALRIRSEGSYTLRAQAMGYRNRSGPELEVIPPEHIEFNFAADTPNSEDSLGYALYPEAFSGIIGMRSIDDPFETHPDRFSVTGAVVTDVISGLEWLVGPDSDMTWYEAYAWVEALGGGWRMPSRAELEELGDSGIRSDCWGPFENSGWWVWSGETREPSCAWGLRFGCESRYLFFGTGEDSYIRTTSRNKRAFAVRAQNGTGV